MSARKILVGSVLAGVVAFGAASAASAQDLNDVWLKLAMATSGYTIDGGSGALKRASAKTTAYMHVTGSSPSYTFALWTQATPGTWSDSYDDSFSTEGADDAMASDVSWTFHVGSADPQGYANLRFVIKRKGTTLKSVTCQSVGGEITDGTLDGTNHFLGDLRIKGKMVSPSKLPFS